jgi:hypothetical protein
MLPPPAVVPILAPFAVVVGVVVDAKGVKGGGGWSFSQ